MSPMKVQRPDGHRVYTCGFMFRGPMVLLVRKNHPEWQADLMNGIGGELEEGESLADCMKREYLEETGWKVPSWDYFAAEHGPGYEVHFFRWFMPPDLVTSHIDWPRNDSDEELEWCDASNPKYPVIGNLNWLLPLALDPRPINVSVHTTGDIRGLKTW